METEITTAKIFTSKVLIRIGSYLTIWLSYLGFMSSHAPLGIEWLSWHSQRIYNAVQYTKINGYFSSFGFSIWSSCRDCGFSLSEWTDHIYLSSTVFKLFPYIFLNHFWDFSVMQKYAPQIDRLAIFVAAAATAELIIICVRKYSTVPEYFVGIVGFLLFTTAPWTYKMLVASWLEIYFLVFFLLALIFFSHDRNKVGLTMLFIAGFFHYQWALALAGLYCLLFLGSQFAREDTDPKQFLPSNGRTVSGFLVIVLVLIVSAAFEGGLRSLALLNMASASGTSLLIRMGISGQDIHNGGLLGALQFLGGNRVTLCIADYGGGILPETLIDGITRYNCILSIGGMVLMSLSAIGGIVILIKKSVCAKWIVFPLAYGLLLFITILQQSLSVHLMGYSYIFSFLFAAGIVSLLVFLAQFIGSVTLKIILSIPCVLGIVSLAVRVSMLTGANG